MTTKIKLADQIRALMKAEPHLSAKDVAARLGIKTQAVYNIRYQDKTKNRVAAAKRKAVKASIAPLVKQEAAPLPKEDLLIEVLRAENHYLRSLVALLQSGGRHGASV